MGTDIRLDTRMLACVLNTKMLACVLNTLNVFEQVHNTLLLYSQVPNNS